MENIEEYKKYSLNAMTRAGGIFAMLGIFIAISGIAVGIILSTWGIGVDQALSESIFITMLITGIVIYILATMIRCYGIITHITQQHNEGTMNTKDSNTTDVGTGSIDETRFNVPIDKIAALLQLLTINPYSIGPVFRTEQIALTCSITARDSFSSYVVSVRVASHDGERVNLRIKYDTSEDDIVTFEPHRHIYCDNHRIPVTPTRKIVLIGLMRDIRRRMIKYSNGDDCLSITLILKRNVEIPRMVFPYECIYLSADITTSIVTIKDNKFDTPIFLFEQGV